MGSLGSWEEFVSHYPSVDDVQDYTDRVPATGPTFLPRIIPAFVEKILARKEVFSEDEVLKAFDVLTRDEPPCSIGLLQDVIRDVSRPLCVRLAYLYTMQSAYYKTLNRCLRDLSDASLDLVAPVTWHMLRARSLSPTFTENVTVYRAMKLTEAEVKCYCAGLVFCWAAFSSCSKLSAVAEGFLLTAGGGDGILFVLSMEPEVAAECAVDVSNLSFFRGEQEVLLMPMTSIWVESVQESLGSQIVTCRVLSTSRDISGVWDCAEDGGVYYVTCSGNHVAWFGHARHDSRFSWGHVFFGELQGTTLKGKFADVPVAHDRLYGDIEVAVDFESMKMARCDTSRRFMGRSWTRRSVALEDSHRPALAWNPVPRDAGLTGLWQSDTGMQYFVAQHQDEIFWLAHHPSWQSANAAMGRKTGSPGTWSMVYQDLILSTRFRYAGKVGVTLSDDKLQLIAENGPYACKTLKKMVA